MTWRDFFTQNELKVMEPFVFIEDWDLALLSTNKGLFDVRVYKNKLEIVHNGSKIISKEKLLKILHDAKYKPMEVIEVDV